MASIWVISGSLERKKVKKSKMKWNENEKEWIKATRKRSYIWAMREEAVIALIFQCKSWMLGTQKNFVYITFFLSPSTFLHIIVLIRVILTHMLMTMFWKCAEYCALVCYMIM